MIMLGKKSIRSCFPIYIIELLSLQSFGAQLVIKTEVFLSEERTEGKKLTLLRTNHVSSTVRSF